MVLFPLDFWQDEGERAVVAAARTELFRVLTVRDGDTSPTGASTRFSSCRHSMP